MLNPKIEVVLRTHSDEAAALLRDEQIGEVFMGEHDLALAMAGAVVARSGARTHGAGEPPTNVAS